MSLNNSESLRFIPFIDPADEWAVTQILQLTTETQLSIAMRLLGLVRNAGGEYRKLSLERIHRERGHSKPSVRGTKDQMVAAGLLVELKAPGRSSLYGLGPEFAGPRYMQLVEQHAELAAADQLPWPFNEAQRAGGRKPADSSNRSSRTTTQERPGNSELPTTRKLRVTPRPGNSELPTPGNSELPPIETLRDIPLEKSSKDRQEQPSAEINTPQSVEVDPFLEENPDLTSVEIGLEGVEPLTAELHSLLVEAIGLQEDGMLWTLNQPCIVEGFHPVERWILLRRLAGPFPNDALDRFYAWGISCLIDQQREVEPQKSSDPNCVANFKIKGIHDHPAVIDDSHLLSTRPSNLKPGDQVLLNDCFCVVQSYDWENERCTVIDLKTNESCCVDVDQVLIAPSSAIVETSA